MSKYKYINGHWINIETNTQVKNGNRIKNSDGSYIQLNSDGTATKLYNAKTGQTNKIVSDSEASMMRKGYVRGDKGWRNEIKAGQSIESWIDQNYNDIVNRIKEDKNYQTQVRRNGIDLNDANMLDKAVQEYGSQLYKQYAASAGRIASDKEKAQYKSQANQRTKNITLNFNDYQRIKPQLEANQQYDDRIQSNLKKIQDQWRRDHAFDGRANEVPTLQDVQSWYATETKKSQTKLDEQLKENPNLLQENYKNYLKDNKDQKISYDDYVKAVRNNIGGSFGDFIDNAGNAQRKNLYKVSDRLGQTMFGLTAAGIGGVAALESGLASWAGRTLWEGGKYMVTHPIESFVVNPAITDFANNHVFNNIENENIREGLSLGTSMLISPNVSQISRRFFGTPLQSKLTTMLDKTILQNIPKYTMNSLTNAGMRFNPGRSFLGNTAVNLYHTLPQTAIATGVGMSGIDKYTNTGIAPIDFAKSALLYGAIAKGTNKGNTLLRNIKLASGGNQTFSEGLGNILKNVKNSPKEFFKEDPNFEDYYTMTISPSENQLKMIDLQGTNVGQGGKNGFAQQNLTETGQHPLRNYNSLKEGQVMGDDGMNLIAKSYVGAPITSRSSIQEILTNRSNSHFTGDVNRQAVGSREAIVNSYGEKIQSPKELIQEGFNEFIGSDGKLRGFTEDPNSINDLYMGMGRGDFQQGNGYSYNGAGQRIVGIFHNPTTKQYRIYMQDPSGIGSVAHQGGQSPIKKVAQEFADSDVPFTHVFKSATIDSPESFDLFVNRYMQSVPNKSHITASPKKMLKAFFGFGKNDISNEATQVISQIRSMEGSNKNITKLKNNADELEKALNNKYISVYQKRLILDDLNTSIKKIDGTYSQHGKQIKKERQNNIKNLQDILSQNGQNYFTEIANLDKPVDYSSYSTNKKGENIQLQNMVSRVNSDITSLQQLKTTVSDPKIISKIDSKIQSLNEYKDNLKLAIGNEEYLPKETFTGDTKKAKVKDFSRTEKTINKSLTEKQYETSYENTHDKLGWIKANGRTIVNRVLNIYKNKQIPREEFNTYPQWLQTELAGQGINVFKQGGKFTQFALQEGLL